MEHYLQHLFAPRSVAVVGASARAGSLGRLAFDNLRHGGFSGPIVPVNPKHQAIDGVPCFPTLSAIGQPIDMVLVATPGSAVPAVIADAARAGARNAVVLSAGFGEIGPEGKALEQEVQRVARENRVRLIGPNCLGIMRPSVGLNATFARSAARPGPVALVSQSGAIAAALVDWADSVHIGFSSVVSMGAGVDLDFGEILDYLLHDIETRSILLYVEGIRDARRFISGLRAAARSKPIVVLKVGRHKAGSRAAMSHTGAMAGDDAVFDAALRRCGVVRVKTYAELFSAARLIGAGRLPQGNRLAILTNGGGPGAMAADFAADCGVEIATLSGPTLTALNASMPAHWSHANPADIIGDADATRLAAALPPLLADPQVDGLLTLFCPQQVLTGEDAAATIIAAAAKTAKPVLTAWLGEHDVAGGRDAAERGGLSAFQSPEAAVAAFAALAEYRHAQKMLMEVPTSLATGSTPDLAFAESLARAALAQGRTLLSEPEAKALLACFGIATPQALVATNLAEARAAAAQIGYPVALKILSPDIAHKSDVNGVRLSVRGEGDLGREFEGLLSDVRAKKPEARIEGVVVQPMVNRRFGRELLVGVATDPVFGPVISFGAGGVAVELMRDHAVGLPPLNRALAEDLVRRTRTSRLLGAYRHVPGADMEAVYGVLLRVSDMVCSLPWIAEMDINPLLADQSGCTALDARVVVDAARLGAMGGTAAGAARDAHFRHMAIHPYPSGLAGEEKLRDGARVRVRPIRPEDAAMEKRFVEELSDQTRYMRFFNPSKTLSREMLARFTQVDYDRELALIALEPAATDKAERIIGVARYTPNPDAVSCEFAVTVADDWQGRGLGKRLMLRLVDAAREAGYQTMLGTVLTMNERMLKMMHALGFAHRVDPQDHTMTEVSLPLAAER